MDNDSLIDLVRCNTANIATLDAKVDAIEISNARVDVQIQHLIDSVNKLAGSVRMVFFGALSLTVSFFVWYVQKL